MKKMIVFALLAASLVACGGMAPTPYPTPTSAPKPVIEIIETASSRDDEGHFYIRGLVRNNSQARASLDKVCCRGFYHDNRLADGCTAYLRPEEIGPGEEGVFFCTLMEFAPGAPVAPIATYHCEIFID